MYDILDIKKQTILTLSERTFETFENATNETIKELNSKLAKLESQFDALSIEIENNKDEAPKDAMSWTTVDEMSWNMEETDSTKEHLLALEEMKIVHLFKSLEIRIKSIIKTAYPDKDFKGAYKWDNMKNLFKNFDIDITILDGYNDAQGLNKINNCIKHSGEIPQDVKSIKEFEKSIELEFENLRVFHNRIRIKIEDFSKALGQAIINDLYHFDDERLGNICMSYVNRMDKETAIKFIEIFISKLKEKSEEEKILELIKAYQNL